MTALVVNFDSHILNPDFTGLAGGGALKTFGIVVLIIAAVAIYSYMHNCARVPGSAIVIVGKWILWNPPPC